MYKLLLVTDQAEIEAAFNEVTSWEGMGFRVPRITSSVHGAIASLKANHADAIVLALPEKDETALLDHLSVFYPILPVCDAEKNVGGIETRMNELRRLLNRTHADFSNDDFGEADMMQVCRHEFFRALLGGKIEHKEDVKRYMRLLRSRMDWDQPCVVLQLRETGESDFRGRWHYGADRLEVALRNFFGVELDGMRMLVSVLEDESICLLACPMRGASASESMTGIVSSHAQDCMEHVRDYLDLDLRIDSIRVLPSLTALAGKQENGKTAF